MDECCLVLGQGDGRDHAVNVGMVLHFAAPGVKHGDAPVTSSFGLGGDDVCEGGGAFA